MTLHLLRAPDAVQVFTDDTHARAEVRGALASAAGVEVHCAIAGDALDVSITAPRVGVQRIHLRWNGELPGAWRVMGDHWERGYGDLAWCGLQPQRVLPWYALLHDGQVTHGLGVQTGPAAFCWWRVDAQGASLWLDVRCGGVGVQLGERTLAAARVVTHRGAEGESWLDAAAALCRRMCPKPLLPAEPVYGGNNWYYAYGHSSHQSLLDDAGRIAELAGDEKVRPFFVVDSGWQPGAADPTKDGAAGGPWDRGNDRHPDMPGLAAGMRQMRVRPGIWWRPLAAAPNVDPRLCLPSDRALDPGARRPILDPSMPEVLETIRTDCTRLVDWGYEMIKHDFSACDVLGRWGKDMGSELTHPGWRFADATHTTAEIILALHRTIRHSAGGALVLGCNTINHLSAGLFELQRGGDDTSGREWERTRLMGVNTLAMRLPQHDTFFAMDADCIGVTGDIPWSLNRQWLDVVARSGTPLFLSIDPDAMAMARRDLRDACAMAARGGVRARPVDAMLTTCPTQWRGDDGDKSYRWIDDGGIGPHGAT